MEAGEFARKHGVHDQFHEAVFKAFFTDCRDIGNREVLVDIARSSGLDTDTLTSELETHTNLPKLEETTRTAHKMQVSAAPTFIIDGLKPITGAQPLDTFRALLRSIQR